MQRRLVMVAALEILLSTIALQAQPKPITTPPGEGRERRRARVLTAGPCNARRLLA